MKKETYMLNIAYMLNLKVSKQTRTEASKNKDMIKIVLNISIN